MEMEDLSEVFDKEVKCWKHHYRNGKHYPVVYIPTNIMTELKIDVGDKFKVFFNREENRIIYEVIK